MTNAYRLVLQCVMDDIEHNVEFDYVEDATTNLSSDITTHPLVNGDSIADHMYKTPSTMSVSGNFSLQGYKPTDFYGDSNDRLTNVETFFERIKNEGIFCTLVKLSMSDDASVRFVARENMVLTSIAWTERQNSLGFSFNFTEALVADVQQLDYVPDVTDENLPALTDASTLDFVDTFVDINMVSQIVQDIFKQYNLISEGFLIAAQSIAASSLAGTVAGAAVVAGIFLAIGSVPVAGWIVAGVAAIAAGIAALITSAVKQGQRAQAEREFRVKAFQEYEDEEKMKAEVERYCNYVGTIHKNLQSLNDRMMLYRVPANVNQECALNVEGDYYVFKFNKNNTSGKWSLKVDNITDGKQDFVKMDELVGFDDLSQLTDDNYLFRTAGTGYCVYVMNFMVGQASKEGKSQAEITALTNDLTNYCILITTVKMSEFAQLLRDIIEDAMRK